jgi:hypothetical protein
VKTLGVPENWPEFNQLPDYSKINFDPVERKKFKDINFLFKTIPDEGIELLSRLLEMNPDL